MRMSGQKQTPLPDSDVAEATEQTTKVHTTPPRRFRVLLHNDDYTTFDFVIMILQTIFYHSDATARQIVLAVHHEGIGLAGVYSREIAEAKCAKVHALAREHEYPLRCSLEAE